MHVYHLHANNYIILHIKDQCDFWNLIPHRTHNVLQLQYQLVLDHILTMLTGLENMVSPRDSF